MISVRAGVSDYTATGFSIVGTPPTKLKAGATIPIRLQGTVKDLLAGYPDQWQVAVAIGISGPDGIDISDSRVYKSANTPVPYSNSISLAGIFMDSFNLGSMPNHDISIVAYLYANQDDRQPFTPWQYDQLDKNGWTWIGSPIVQTIKVDTAQIGSLRVYIYRGDQALPAGGLVKPGEEIILQGEGTGLLASGVEFILTDSSGLVVQDIWGANNPFESAASARITAPITEGEYTLVGQDLPFIKSAPYKFSVSHLASAPPAGSKSWQDQIGSAVKMLVIGGLLIGGAYFVVKSGVLVTGASAAKKKLQAKYG